MIHIETVTVDADDPAAIAGFWAALLGGETEVDDDDDVVVRAPGSAELLFQKVPEGKRVKNRIHLDLRPDDQDAEVARAEALGASRVDIGQSASDTWVVLADPEGNEFCILRSRS